MQDHQQAQRQRGALLIFNVVVLIDQNRDGKCTKCRDSYTFVDKSDSETSSAEGNKKTEKYLRFESLVKLMLKHFRKICEEKRAQTTVKLRYK